MEHRYIWPGNWRSRPVTDLCAALYFATNAHIFPEEGNLGKRRPEMGKFAAILLTALIALPGATAAAGEGSGSFSGASGHKTGY